MYLVLGAGIAGLSAVYHLGLVGKKTVVFEKHDRWGGLCDNFEVDGFRFDHAIHLSFTCDEYVKKLFRESCEYHTHVPIIGNIYRNHWIKHPAQNNLYPLKIEEKVAAIVDFAQNNNPADNIQNYEMWLRAQYGNYFAEHFPMPYTKKYWTVEAKALGTSWIGERMYRPSLQEVLTGAMSEETPNTYYADEMRYPQKGGYKSFLSVMADKCDIRLNKKAISIDSRTKKVMFEDGKIEHYETLISSIPLPELIKLIKDVPKHVIEASQMLTATSVALVSVGLKSANTPPHLWFYIYNADFLPARCYSPSLKSKDNVPDECTSLQFEVHYSKDKPLKLEGDSLIEHVIEKGSALGLFEKNDIAVTDYRKLPYGNVLFKHGMEEKRSIVHEYLDSINIKYCGRFGEWDYLWSDQSLMSGKRVADKIINQKSG